jgi:hypothetical protein
MGGQEGFLPGETEKITNTATPTPTPTATFSATLVTTSFTTNPHSKQWWQVPDICNPGWLYNDCVSQEARDSANDWISTLLASPASKRSHGPVRVSMDIIGGCSDHACEDWSLYLPGTTCGKAVAAAVTAAQRACAQARFAHWYAAGYAYDACPPSVLRNLPRPYLTLPCFDPDFEKLAEVIQELRSDGEDAGGLSSSLSLSGTASAVHLAAAGTGGGVALAASVPIVATPTTGRSAVTL